MSGEIKKLNVYVCIKIIECSCCESIKYVFNIVLWWDYSFILKILSRKYY